MTGCSIFGTVDQSMFHGLNVSDVSGAKVSCCDITSKLIPGSPPPLYFSSGRGESLGARLVKYIATASQWCEVILY